MSAVIKNRGHHTQRRLLQRFHLTDQQGAVAIGQAQVNECEVRRQVCQLLTGIAQMSRGTDLRVRKYLPAQGGQPGGNFREVFNDEQLIHGVS